MKILLIDTMAAFLDFALRCEAHGHEVRWFNRKLPDGQQHPAGKGLIKRVDEWRPSMKWADLIVTSDNAHYVNELESYRNEGYPIFGCHKECAAWELEREVGQEILSQHGVEGLPFLKFSNYDQAIAHVKANPGIRYVSKPLGDADKALSYVSKSSQDLLFMLDYWKRTQRKSAPFILQEFTPGVEVAVGAWVGASGFTSYCMENFEFKKLMNGEVGVNTGEMGTVMKYSLFEESLLAQKVLAPLEATLIRNGYTGYIDVAVIIDDKGNPWPLEFTTRPGWPLFQIQQVLHPEPCQWMLDLLHGVDSFRPYADVALGVVVAMPDFPYGKVKPHDCCDFPVWGINDKNRYWIHPCEMKLGTAPVLKGESIVEEPMLVTAGSYVLVATGAGQTVEEAKCNAYGHLKELEIPNSPMYRTDIGGRIEGQLPLLQKNGYATNWVWG